MFTKDELTEKSPEDKYLDREDEINRLLEYDKKIDKILYCLLTDKEAKIFDLRIGSRHRWESISKETTIPEATVRAIFGKISRKLKTFREFMAVFNFKH